MVPMCAQVIFESIPQSLFQLSLASAEPLIVGSVCISWVSLPPQAVVGSHNGSASSTYKTRITALPLSLQESALTGWLNYFKNCVFLYFIYLFLPRQFTS